MATDDEQLTASVTYTGSSPGEYLATGIVLSIVAGIAFAFASIGAWIAAIVGAALSVAATIMLGIGIVAKGVQVGRRWP